MRSYATPAIFRRFRGILVGICGGQQRPVAAVRASQANGRICDLSFVKVERTDDFDPLQSLEGANYTALNPD